MAERRSVLDPKPRVVLADDQRLAPRPDWRRWRTWGVFLGLGCAPSLANGLLVILCAVAVELAIRDQTLGILVGTGLAFTLSFIGSFALKRAIPLRDTEGRLVPGNPRLDLAMLPLALLLAIPWAIGFSVVSLQIVILVRDLAGAFSDQLPIWAMSVVVLFSFMVFEAPFRILWRAPVEAPDRDD